MRPDRGETGGALGWIGTNLVLFLLAWIVLGAVYGSVVAWVEDSGEPALDAPDSIRDVLALPLAFLVLALIGVFVAVAGLVLLAPLVLPGLALYLAAVWWSARVLPRRWQRPAAVALSPLIPLLVIIGQAWLSLDLAMVGSAAVYGWVVRLPCHAGRSRRGPRSGQSP